MPYIILSLVMIVLSIIFRLASVFRLTIPLLYALVGPLIFPTWFAEQEQLALIIWFVLLGLVVLSWIYSLVRKIHAIVEQRREDKAVVLIFKDRLRKAKENGEGTVSTENLWH